MHVFKLVFVILCAQAASASEVIEFGQVRLNSQIRQFLNQDYTRQFTRGPGDVGAMLFEQKNNETYLSFMIVGESAISRLIQVPVRSLGLSVEARLAQAEAATDTPQFLVSLDPDWIKVVSSRIYAKYRYDDFIDLYLVEGRLHVMQKTVSYRRSLWLGRKGKWKPMSGDTFSRETAVYNVRPNKGSRTIERFEALAAARRENLAHLRRSDDCEDSLGIGPLPPVRW